MNERLPIQNSDVDNDPKYRIGAVANLTGLTVYTIRAWEKRYDLGCASRSEGGTRLYSENDVLKLTLLRALTKQGEPIGVIAGLSESELRERLRKYADIGWADDKPMDNGDTAKRFRVGLFGHDVVARFGDKTPVTVPLEINARFPSREAAFEDIEPSSVDAIIVSIEGGRDNISAFLSKWRAVSEDSLVIVLYEFASSKMLISLAQPGVKFINWLTDTEQLYRSSYDYMVMHSLSNGVRLKPGMNGGDEEFAERVFSYEQLASLTEIPTKIECECPHHLVSILFKLNAFEAYCQNCESQNKGDAALHTELKRETGRARAIMERMLSKVCAYDGIQI